MKSRLTRNGSVGGLIWLVAMCILLSIRLEAQSFYGSVVGTVTDSTGASVPDATITLISIGINGVQTAQSDPKGNFSFVNLVPAVYSVRAEKAGFKAFLQGDVSVEVGGIVRIDPSLTVGDVSQTVQVSAASPLLQTDTSSLNQEIPSVAVAQIPINGRNVMNLLTLTPGVIGNGGAGGSAGLDQNGGSRTAGGVGWGNYQIGGAIQGQSAYYVDGVPNNLLGGNILALVPTLDAVQEFSVVTSNATADFGRFAGGVVNMTTKSGSNAFHGGIWEYFRNADLNANDYFTNHAGDPRPQWNQNQYGAIVTGPIKRDKLFFMGAWENFKALTSNPNSTIVPTSAASRSKWGGSDMQDGIFPNAIADPTGNCNISTTVNPGYWTITNLYGAGKNGGTCGDPTNQVLKTYYPDPNQNPNTNTYDWFRVSSLVDTQHQYNGRIDWVINPKQRFFGRYTYWSASDSGHSEFGNQGLGSVTWPTTEPGTTYKTHQAVLGDTYTLSPTTVLDVRVDFARLSNINAPEETKADYSQFGSTYATLSKQFTLDTLPNYALNGNHNLFNWSNFNKFNANWYDTYAINANVVKIIGQHNLKFGTELRLMDVTGTNYVGSAGGTYTYGTSFTGDEFAAFLMGYPNQTQFQQYEPSAGYTYYQAYYASDNWQVARNLTLNLGLRWELPGGISERNNRTTVLLPDALDPYTGITGTQSLVASPLYPGRSVVEPQHNLFAPRVGFAYRVGADTVVHAGYGISYLPNDISGPNGLGTMPYNSVVNLSNTTVNVASGGAPQQLQGILQGLVTSGINQPIGRTQPGFMTKYASTSTYLGQTIEAPDPYQPGYPRVQQWNLDVSHQFKGDMMLEVAYSGLKGSNLPGIGNAATLSYQSLNELQSQYYSLADATATTGTLAGQPNSGLTTVEPCARANGEVMSAGQCLRKYPYYADFQDGAAFDSRQNYKSVFFQGKKRFGSAGMLMANYTWARNMSNTDTQNSWLESKATLQGGVGAGGVQDYNNLNGEYSLLSYDVENSTVVSYVLPLPFGKGQKFGNDLSGIGSTLASGWQVGGITSFSSGFPIYISTNSDNLLTSTSGPGLGAGQLRPNVVPGCDPKIGGSGLTRVKNGAWFNVSCFVWPTSSSDPAGLATFGNEPRVDPSLRQDGVKNFDFTFQKVTRFYESANLEFRAEFYNIFNRVQFAGPIPQAPLSETSQTINPAAAGGFGSVAYQFNHPRQIQLSLRINF